VTGTFVGLPELDARPYGSDPVKEAVLRFARRRSASSVLAVLLLATSLIPTAAAAPTPAQAPTPAVADTRVAPAEQPPVTEQDPAGLRSSIHWEEVQAHANDKIDFAPGGRVTVPFRPSAHDRWEVGGAAPRGLPAGRLSGRQLRDALKPTPAAAPASTPESPEALPTVELPPAPTETPADPTAEPSADTTPVESSDPSPTPAATETPVDQPVLDEGEAIPAEGASWSPEANASVAAPAAAVSAGGLTREVFGFLPYWEVSDSSTTIDYTKISTIAYFGVGAAANGSLEKKNKDGSTTTGWNGWTSSALTNVINKAHQSHTRVVLTVQSFAWSSGGSTKQKALLGSSTARAALAKNIAVAVRDRGADGVNLDFEPLASGYADEFVSLVKRVRTELDAVAKGYQLTFDTTGYIGNYPLEAATAAGAADAIFIMGYDYRSAGSSPVGSIAPIGGTSYDIVDTVKAYRARVPASKLILGVPYYGRAWSTDSDKLHAKNISGTKYGSSTTVIYANGIVVLQEHGRQRDAVEGVAWTAYRRENCSSTYGCVTSWRQLYLDDAYALRSKYDIVNNYDLRGVGMWALGYDNARPELWTAIKDKFVSATPFTDIDDFATEIAWLYESGITGGCTPTLFCPNAKVTRAQMAMFLDRALELPAATTDYFDDDDGKTGEGSINALAKAKITGGCGSRRFCPTAYVTRAQMAMFLDRALALPNTTTDYFDDDDGRTGEGSINALALSQITGGCGDRRFCPSSAVTREQMAAFLYRAYLQERLP
jgi:spore germination protein YaaH